ncbi:MAG: hypothetical protein J0H99_15700, partial [Rhodospirillales bacterium]|nr:hypothetical protein [Rhodospirillales bacterium]
MPAPFVVYSTNHSEIERIPSAWRSSSYYRWEEILRTPLIRLGLLSVILILAAESSAHAQAVNVLDQVVSQFQLRSAGWQAGLTSFAINTFGILAGIDLT